jgi:hypothetical protein
VGIVESQPELLARHCTEAGQIEKAAGLWGKAGQRSLERSALVEATVQLARALDQIAALPATPALPARRLLQHVDVVKPVRHECAGCHEVTPALALQPGQIARSSHTHGILDWRRTQRGR